MRQTTFWFLILLLAAVPAADAQSRKKPRDYKMGISYFPFDLTMEAALKTREFVKDHADLIPIKQEDGWIPWAMR